MSRFLFLWRFVSDQKLKLFFALFSLAFISGTSLVYPWLLKIMVDAMGSNVINGVSVTTLTILLLLVVFISALLGYYSYVLMQDIGFRLRNNLRTTYFDFLLYRSMSFFKDKQVGELSARASDDIGKVQPVFSGLVSTIFQNVLFIIGCLILMLMLNPFATLLVLLLILIPVPLLILFSRKIRKLSSSSQAEQDSASAVMEESLVGIREIKSFTLEKLKLSGYAEFLYNGMQKEIRSSKLHSKISHVFYFVISVMLLAIFYKGSILSGSSGWSIGGVIAFYFYAYTLAMAFLAMGRTYMSYQTIAGAADRIHDLLGDYQPVNVFFPISTTLSLKGHIEFKNVSFGYQNLPDGKAGSQRIFSNISFNIDEGSWFLITGPSGSGKSTIANLILRFYKIDKGDLLLDDISINSLDEISIRKSIGFVGQDPILFQGTIKDNILLGRIVSEERFNKTLKISCLNNFVSDLSLGIESVIGERGITLSGGQRARIAIARAIVSNPPILILDEAGAQLEGDLETELWNNLQADRKDKTTIILSHHIENIPRIYQHMALSTNNH
jgi:ABC-type multidrug transport system fused ATPase/permease subunit